MRKRLAISAYFFERIRIREVVHSILRRARGGSRGLNEKRVGLALLGTGHWLTS